MIIKGPQELKVTTPCSIQIKADASFMTYGLCNNKEMYLLGPLVDGGRVLSTKIPDEVDTIRIKTSKNSTLEVHVIPIQVHQVPDPTPVEVPINMGKPLTMEQEMQRFFAQAIRQYAPGDDENFLDEYDMDVDAVEQENFDTPYTIPDDIDAQIANLLQPEREPGIEPGQQAAEQRSNQDDLPNTSSDSASQTTTEQPEPTGSAGTPSDR